METRLYQIKHLRDFCVRVFLRCEVPEEDAMSAADVLTTADLWGIDSHGIARLRSYYEVLERGLVNPRPQIRIVRELPGTATIDGDNGLGLVVGPRANELALEKAEATGAGWVSVCNSNHFGIAGYYTWQALSRDLIGWAMTNTSPLVSPLWGAERMLGTNPISVAFPAREEPPVIVDFATSAISFGTAETAIRNGQILPEGLMIDSEGRPTNLPRDVVEGGHCCRWVLIGYVAGTKVIA
jgi:LDH2 family malate/lactate/ureidoglycolate dehydrogenase